MKIQLYIPGKFTVAAWFMLVSLVTVYSDFAPEDTIVLKDGSVYTGIVSFETPRAVVLKTGENSRQFKRHIVRDIRYHSAAVDKNVKYRNDRSYRKYDNYAIDLNEIPAVLAVLDIASAGDSLRIYADSLTRILTALEPLAAGCSVLDRDYVKEVLGIQGLQAEASCRTAACAVEVGSFLGADRVLHGSLEASELEWKLAIQFSDIGRNTSEPEITVSGNNFAVLLEQVRSRDWGCR